RHVDDDRPFQQLGDDLIVAHPRAARAGVARGHAEAEIMRRLVLGEPFAEPVAQVIAQRGELRQRQLLPARRVVDIYGKMPDQRRGKQPLDEINQPAPLARIIHRRLLFIDGGMLEPRGKALLPSLFAARIFPELVKAFAGRGVRYLGGLGGVVIGLVEILYEVKLEGQEGPEKNKEFAQWD